MFAKWVFYWAFTHTESLLVSSESLGQFNAISIQLSFGLFVYPCLVLAYLGQGAKVITEGETVMSNIFYTTIPGRHNGPLYWIEWLFALLATVWWHRSNIYIMIAYV